MALLTAIASARGANAATIYLGSRFDVEASYLVAIGPDLRAFTLKAVGKNGAQPRVFDGTNSGQGGTGITTTDNRLHQVWEGGFVPTPTLSLVVPGGIPQLIDSHFLVNTSSLFITQLPTENRPLVDPAQHPFAGYGSFLTGAFALVGTVSSTWDFAYVVVPAGTTVNFNFELGAAGFPSEQITRSLTMTYTPGDVNIDGIINILDINLVSSNWNTTGPAGDANGDGMVNIFDINLISTKWTPTMGSSPPPSPAIPEPDALALAALGIFALLARNAIRHGHCSVARKRRAAERRAQGGRMPHRPSSLVLRARTDNT